MSVFNPDDQRKKESQRERKAGQEAPAASAATGAAQRAAARQDLSLTDLTAALRARLDGDEMLLWSGQPIPARVFKAALPIFFFAIPWTAFSCFWVLMALAGTVGHLHKEPSWTGLAVAIIFPLFGLPFIAIGIWMLKKPFQVRRQAGQTLFALTTRRALIFSRGSKQELRSFPLAGLEEKMTFSEEADGSGSLLFTRARSQDESADSDPFTRGFEYIPRVREAESALRRALAMGHGEVGEADAPRQ